MLLFQLKQVLRIRFYLENYVSKHRRPRTATQESAHSQKLLDKQNNEDDDNEIADESSSTNVNDQRHKKESGAGAEFLPAIASRPKTADVFDICCLTSLDSCIYFTIWGFLFG